MHLDDLHRALDRKPSQESFRRIVHLVEQAFDTLDGPSASHWLAIAQSHMTSWDHRNRLSPRHWFTRLARGEHHPLFSLATGLHLASISPSLEEIVTLITSPSCAHMRYLDLDYNSLNDHDIAELADNPALGQFEILGLSGSVLSARGLARLARSQHVSGLRELDLAHARLSGDALEALAQHAHMHHLETLCMCKNEIDNAGLEALAHWAPPRLRELHLTDAYFDLEGLRALLRSPLPRQLTHLKFCNSSLDDEAIEELFVRHEWPQLQYLDLYGNHLSPRAAELLARSFLPALDELDLGFNCLGDRGLGALLAIESPLEILSLRGNGLSDKSVELIVGSSHMHRLRKIRLQDNGIRAEALRALEHIVGTVAMQACGLGGNPIGGEGLGALTRSQLPHHLRELHLWRTGLQSDDLATLAQCRALGGLRKLDLQNNAIEDARTLLHAAEHFPNLTYLNLEQNALKAFSPLPLAWTQLEELRLEGPIAKRDIEALCRSPLMHGLRALALKNCPLDARQLSALSRAEPPCKLRSLSLSTCQIDVEGIEALCATRRGRRPLDQLEILHLDGNTVSELGARHLTTSTTIGHPITLNLGHARLGDPGVVALCEGDFLERCHHLRIQGNSIQSDGFRALAHCTALGHLKTLWAFRNNAGSRGAQAIADADQFQLSKLFLSHNRLGDEGARALAESSSLRACLDTLGLRDNDISAVGAETLATSPILAKVVDLRLSRNPVGPRFFELLRARELPHLRELTVHAVSMESRGFLAIAEAPWSANLSYLGLNSNAISPEAWTRFWERTQPHRLRTLFAGGQTLGTTSVEALSRWPGRRQLRRLALWGTGFDDEAAELVADDPGFAGLTGLFLSYSEKLSSQGVRALAGAEHLGCLRELNLNNCPAIELAAVRELMRSPGLNTLHTLHLADTITEQDEQEELRALARPGLTLIFRR